MFYIQNDCLTINLHLVFLFHIRAFTLLDIYISYKLFLCLQLLLYYININKVLVSLWEKIGNICIKKRRKFTCWLKCRSLSVMTVLSITFHLAYLCRLVLFGNDPLIDLKYEIYVDRCSTCRFQREHENICFDQAPSTNRNSCRY